MDGKSFFTILFKRFNCTVFPIYLFLFCITLYADTYYVSTDGNNSNNGSESAPWKTIQKAANTLEAGDTVLVREGTYNEKVAVQNSGSPGNFIVFMAYPGEEVTVDAEGENISIFGQGAFQANNQDYIMIHGFRVINSSGAGIYTRYSSHIIFRKNYTYNTGSSGIGVWNTVNALVDSNEVEYANAAGGGTQENISIAQTDTFEVCYNHVHHSAGQEGLDVKDGSSNGTVHHNEVNNIYKLGIYVDSWDKPTFNIHVYQNVVYECGHDGFDVAAEKGGMVEDVWIYNNIAYNNHSMGITFAGWGEEGYDHPMKDIYIINNVFYGNETHGIYTNNSDIVSNIIIRNNICSQNGGSQIALGSAPVEALTIENNLVYGGGGTAGDNAVEEDPLFADADQADFTLLEGSPAIDAGSSTDAPDFDYAGNARPAGSGIDIGAYEFSATEMIRRISDPAVRERIKMMIGRSNGVTRICFENPKSSDVTLRVYNPAGRLVRTLANTSRSAGRHTILWDHKVDTNAGIYFIQLNTTNQTVTKKTAILH